MHRTPTLLAVVAILAVFLLACSPGSGSGGPTTADEAVALALAQEPQFTGIGPLDSNLIGQAAWYEVAETSSGWQVRIRIGWGDCPAGCISEHRWIYDIGRDGSVALAGEEGDPLPGPSGIEGSVLAGPTCPVVTDPPDPNCAEQPVEGALLIIEDGAGIQVAQVRSDADGHFAVELAPGSYRLVPQPVEGLMGTAPAVEFGVELGQPAVPLTVSYDTGIR